MYRRKSCHCPDAGAGPKERAVFGDAPVSGPNTMAARPNRGGDGERGGRADGAGVGRDAHDDQHEQRGEDHSDDERAADGDAGDGRAEVRGTRGPDDEQQQRGEGRAGELRRPVGAEVAGRQVPGEEEAEADAGVEVRSADMAEGGDGGEENEEEHEADADHAERSVALGIGDDGSAAGEDEGERADAPGEGVAKRARRRDAGSKRPPVDVLSTSEGQPRRARCPLTRASGTS